MNIWYWVLFVGALSDLSASTGMLLIMFRLKSRQKLAYQGDRSAADHLVLPCFLPIFNGIVVIFFLLSCTVIVSTFVLLDTAELCIRVIQYKLCLVCCILAVAPVLMTQKSISATSGKRVFLRLLPWFLAVSVLCFADAFVYHDGRRYLLQIPILIIASFLPIVFCCLLISKTIWCRLQFASASNRSSIQHLLVFSVLYVVFNICYILRNEISVLSGIAMATVFAMYILIACFPISLYRTFLADTKFWRGLGRHNRGGIRRSASSAAILPGAAGRALSGALGPGLDEERGDGQRDSEMNVSTASKQFQNMMNDISDVMIDFAFIELGPVIGHGASAEVIFGTYQTKKVAIKVSAPPEITEDVLDSFYAEALVTSSLDHPNVVKFYGICVKPPEIGMVIEFCSHGNLRDSLVHEASEWTHQRRILAALHASRAIAYMHSQGVIHRDIKADNFFVDEEWNVKLGDFGESVFKQNYEPGRRMTVLGTVAFMAPELVEGKPVYTEAIDVYALGITLWEIWTGMDPFENTTTFSIYSKVMSGERPPIPENAPDAFVDIMCLAWDQDPGRRPSAEDVVLALEALLASGVYTKKSPANPKEGRGGNSSITKRPNIIETVAIEMSSNPIFRDAGTADFI